MIERNFNIFAFEHKQYLTIMYVIKNNFFSRHFLSKLNGNLYGILYIFSVSLIWQDWNKIHNTAYLYIFTYLSALVCMLFFFLGNKTNILISVKLFFTNIKK